MFDNTLEDLEREVKEYKEMYKNDLEEVEQANEHLVKTSERYFKAQVELLNFKLKEVSK